MKHLFLISLILLGLATPSTTWATEYQFKCLDMFRVMKLVTLEGDSIDHAVIDYAKRKNTGVITSNAPLCEKSLWTPTKWKTKGTTKKATTCANSRPSH